MKSNLSSTSFSTSRAHSGLNPEDVIPTKKPVNRITTRFVPFLRKSGEEYKEEMGDTIESHKVLIEGGYIKQISSGVYTFLPLGTRVMEKLVSLIDKSLHKIGCEKVMMPSLLQSELWEETGRWQTAGKELFRLADRKDHQYCLAPTHEECVTDVVRSLVSSYKQVPLRLYQIGVKFRDELRPRYGLMRAKEFIMKDLYSFDIDREGAYRAYDEVVGAYKQIFDLLELDYAMVDADTGNIGGDKSHEFQVLSDVGEDFICRCNCERKYCANVEKGAGVSPEAFKENSNVSYFSETIHTKTSFEVLQNISELLPLFDVYFVPTEPIKHVQRSKAGYTKTFIIVRKGDKINHIKLADSIKGIEKVEVGLGEIVKLDSVQDKVLQKSTSTVILLVDSSVNPTVVESLSVPKGDTTMCKTMLREVKKNDICMSGAEGCQHTPMDIKKGIEIGHVFYLGKKYSEPMKVYIANQDGKRDLADMGCYGIGVSRLFQAVAETHKSEKGVCWPMSIAPFKVSIVPLVPTANMLSMYKPEEIEEKRQSLISSSEALYHKLNSISCFKNEILFDDRLKERPPIRLYDVSRFGVPYAIIYGKDFIDSGVIELQDRANGKMTKVTEQEAIAFLEKVAQKHEEKMSQLE